MTQHNVREMLDVAEVVRPEGESLSTEDLDLHEIDNSLEALKVWRAAHMQKMAADAVLRVAGTRLAELLGEGGAAAIGDNIVRYRRQSKETCIDPDGFNNYLIERFGAQTLEPFEAFNLNYAKKSWMEKGVRDTFFERIQDDDATLAIVPRDRAPQFLQSLEDGQVLIRTTPEEV